MQVGDLVKYRYGQQDVGTIIERKQETDEHTPKFKVLWFGPRNLTDWMRPTGLEMVRELGRKSDIFVQNFRNGVAERLGLGYEELK